MLRGTTRHWTTDAEPKMGEDTFINCSMALEARELDRNRVFGSAVVNRKQRAIENKEEKRFGIRVSNYFFSL